MELEYELNREDLIALNHHVLTRTQYGRRQKQYMIRNFRMLLPLGAAAITLLVTNNLIILAGIFASVGIVTWFTTPLLISWHISRLLRHMTKGTDESSSGLYTLTLHDDGLHQRSEKGTMTINWDSVERLEESAAHAFIFVGPTQALLIPKRIGTDHVNAFVQEVKRRTEQVEEQGVI